ncbi:LuxR C-terminal-related transcriptional regulator [Streptomyces sp. NPDC096057]|uniref:LuxR C-terminal-related transcriptional regulator n=1 Tax=Streptomyces sp. NPDC096057 TaxID=3155543 RepID=UPI003318BDA5
MTVSTGVMSNAGNLPAALTVFVGRSREIDEVRRVLDEARLLTLTGAGGVGKSRLAVQVAAGTAGWFADGAWVVDLTAVRAPSAVPDAVATALGLPDLGTRPVLEQLAGYLAGRRALIVLDNCEHLVGACAELATALLSAAAGLHMLATSRETLGVTGEQVFGVPPLAPDEAIELLRARATALRPDFRVTDANRVHVLRLCADLDGLPLAIELAAARLRTLTVDQAAARLEDRFTLLNAGSRSAPPRQRTLRALVDWSWELCTPAERLLWNRLSVFTGSFCLDAAEQVCAGDGIAAYEVLDLLDRLVAQSVVLTCEAEGLPRYRLLETIRHYGRERLAESGEKEQALRRHRDFCLALAEGVERDWHGPRQVENLARLRAEHGNLLAALSCDADPQARLALATALAFHWCVGGFLGEGRRQFDRALAAAPGPTPARARALVAAAWVALSQGDLAAADRWLDEADALGERLGDPAVLANVRGFRGVSAHYRGRIDEAMPRYEDAAAALTTRGDERGAAGWLLALACVQAYVGDPRATETGGRLITAAEANGERWGRAQVLLALGFDAWQRGDRQRTGGLVLAALESMRGFNDCAAVARMLEVLACATAAAGENRQAARLLGAADTLWRDAGTDITAFDPQLAAHHARCEEEVIAALGRTSYAQAFAEGGTHGGPGRAIALALDPGTGAGPGGPATAPSPLTRRERDVAALVAKGMSNRQIGSALGRSPRTIDGHVENILAKLGFGSRAQIASWWTANQAPTP